MYARCMIFAKLREKFNQVDATIREKFTDHREERERKQLHIIARHAVFHEENTAKMKDRERIARIGRG